MKSDRQCLARAVFGPVLACAASALAAGCAGMQQTPPTTSLGGPAMTTPMQGAASLPQAGKGGSQVLYVSNWYRQAVEVISVPKHTLIREISTSPYYPDSVRVDSSGDLWVALDSYGSQPSLWVYKPGASTPFRALSGIGQATAVAIDRNGTAYVTEQDSSAATIWVFAPGSNQPTSHLTDPSGTCCGWVAVDEHHDVFFAYESQSGHTGAIDEFVHGSTTPKSLGITLATFPGGIEVLHDGTIVVTEQGIVDFNLPAKIDTFPKGATTPSSVITGDPYCDEWVGPAFNRKKNRIYVGTIFRQTSCFISGTPAAIKEFSYPGGKLLAKFATGITEQAGWTLLVPALDPPVAGQ